MGACRRPLLGKYTLCYCCFSSAGRWQTHADIKAAGLEIGGQAVEGKRLWSEKINEGNPIAPYLRQTSSSKSLRAHTHRHTRGLTCRDPCEALRGPTELHPWGGSSNHTSSVLQQKHTYTTHFAIQLSSNLRQNLSSIGC